MTSIEMHHKNPLVDHLDLSMSDNETKPSQTALHQEPLIAHCVANNKVFTFLRLTANYWPATTDELFAIHRTWFMVARLANFLTCAVGALYIYILVEKVNGHYLMRAGNVGIDIAIIVRILSLVPAQFYNQKRLQRPAAHHDADVLDASVDTAIKFGVAGICTTILSTVLFAAGHNTLDTVVFIDEYFVSAYLAFNMFFLLLDINVCLLLLAQLHQLADSKQLTMTKYLQVKEEIHRRVRESRWVSDIIIVPCAVCVGSIAFMIWVLLDVHTVPLNVKLSLTAFIALMLKELIFMCIAFWYVAKLNGRADELTAKLAEAEWGGYTDAPNDLESSPMLETAKVSDIHRLSIYASSLSKPISYTLVFKRVTWWNVAVSAGGFVLAIVIGIIRNLILADV